MRPGTLPGWGGWQARPLAHDQEKWAQVFHRDKRKVRLREDHAQTAKRLPFNGPTLVPPGWNIGSSDYWQVIVFWWALDLTFA